MQDSNISHILKSPIGDTLCKGFAALYRAQPQFPVTYLSNWLLQQSKNRQDINKSKQIEILKEQKRNELIEIQRKRDDAYDNRKIEPVIDEKLEVLKIIMEQYKFKQDMLNEVLPEFIREKEKVEAAYIAYQQFPLQKLQQSQDFIEDTESPKILKYIGASKNNKQLMIGKILDQTQGISWNILKAQQQEQVQQNQQNEQLKKQIKLRHIYIPNVLKQSQMHYFRLPKLGCYLAFQWIIQSYLVQQAFDKGGQKEKQHKQLIQTIKSQHQQKITQMKTELQQFETKQNYQQDQAYINLKLEYETLQSTSLVFPPLEFPSIQKRFLFACDTLGKDSQITKQSQQNIEKVLIYFKRQWELSERQALIADLQLYSNYQNTVELEAQKLQEQLQTEGNNHIQKLAQKVFTEKDQQYQIQDFRFNLLKKHFVQKGVQYLTFYSGYNISKFQGLTKDLLLFSNHLITENQNQFKSLSWRQIRQLIGELSTKILQRISLIENRITQQQQSYLNKLNQKLEKYDFEAIAVYNVGLWMLGQLVKKYIELTFLACEVFQEKKQTFLRDRQSKIEEKERIIQQRSKALQEHLQSLQEDQKQKFDEIQWLVNYDTQHPIPIIEDIPPQYVNPKDPQEQEQQKQQQFLNQEKQSQNVHQQGQIKNIQNNQEDQDNNKPNSKQSLKENQNETIHKQQNKQDEQQDEGQKQQKQNAEVEVQQNTNQENTNSQTPTGGQQLAQETQIKQPTQ